MRCWGSGKSTKRERCCIAALLKKDRVETSISFGALEVGEKSPHPYISVRVSFLEDSLTRVSSTGCGRARGSSIEPYSGCAAVRKVSIN